MAKPDSKELNLLIVQIRSSFNLLKARGEQLLADIQINPSMRAVLEALYKKGPQTVPQIAKQKNVSRQHIQVIMNALLQSEHVEQADNPAHKRSPVFSLTGIGKSAFEEALKREAKPLREMADALPLQDLPVATRFLEHLNEELTRQIKKGEK